MPKRALHAAKHQRLTRPSTKDPLQLRISAAVHQPSESGAAKIGPTLGRVAVMADALPRLVVRPDRIAVGRRPRRRSARQGPFDSGRQTFALLFGEPLVALLKAWQHLARKELER